jgi:hypothetical protein
MSERLSFVLGVGENSEGVYIAGGLQGVLFQVGAGLTIDLSL